MFKATLKKLCALTSILFLIASCSSNTGMPPTVATQTISAVTQTTANCEGNVTSDAGANITSRGICWSFMPEPTIKSNVITSAEGTGKFVCLLNNIYPGTTYYLRAYATNANGTGYGSVCLLTTPPEAGSPSSILNTDLSYSTVSDFDGNKYHTITIGTQTWMAENLQVTKFRNGDPITLQTSNTGWANLTTAANCSYNNYSDSNSVAKFGRLYNYYAVTDSRQIAPLGWHIATDAEWTKLTEYCAKNLGIATTVAQSLAAKTDWTNSSAIGAVAWLDPDTGSSINNSSGFSALPSGIRGEYGDFNYVASYTAWWTSTENDKKSAWFRSLNYYGTALGKNTYNKSFGLSVRCIKD